jgi:adenylosuccinate synthase
MSITAVLGCLYGDEAKAKIIDVLAVDADVVIRFQGGSNAGHTVIFNGEKYVMHLIPSGIFHSDQICVLASGVVIDPIQLESEMLSFADKNIDFSDRFFIDERAAIVLPIHKQIDMQVESLHGEKKIGTTGRGIGPCYSDSISRVGIRICDLGHRELLVEKISFLYKYHQKDIEKGELDLLVNQLHEFSVRMSHHFINLPYRLNEWITGKKEILFEGAQGSLLDVYFGTYPYVTSSHTIAGGIAIAVGMSPKKIDKLIGVMKSYFTRVGSGPFPTELNNTIGEQIRKQGNEFGSTTGRPRRCGWFDIVAARYSVMINGIDEIALTLLDVLSGFETISVCINYHLDGKLLSEIPINTNILERVSPIYIDLPGWDEDISNCKSWEALPQNAQNYVQKIEDLVGVPIKILSVGPSREQTIRL